MSKRKHMVLTFTARFIGPTTELQAFARVLLDKVPKLAGTKILTFETKTSITELYDPKEE